MEPSAKIADAKGKVERAVTEPLVISYHEGLVVDFERAGEHTPSRFGGPAETKIVGAAHGPAPLHLVARLGSGHVPALSRHAILDLPLLYGLRYDGCELSYRLAGTGTVELIHIDPARSSEDWPYIDFPPLLPFVPLKPAGPPRQASYADFARQFPVMPAEQSGRLVVAVPPPATVGLSLWGMGDQDGVTIVFACDLAQRLIHAFNVTT